MQKSLIIYLYILKELIETYFTAIFYSKGTTCAKTVYEPDVEKRKEELA